MDIGTANIYILFFPFFGALWGSVGLCGKSSVHLVGTVGALYKTILKLANIILFLSQVLAFSRGSVAHLKK